MKWVRTMVLFDQGDVISSSGWQKVHEDYIASIQEIKHPPGSNDLTIREKTQKPNGQWNRNGVLYLRNTFVQNMKNKGWNTEESVDLNRIRQPFSATLYPDTSSRYEQPVSSEYGGFDVVTTYEGIKIAVEWETGNVSSSHRSMNKLAISLEKGIIQVGVLIVPSRNLYQHLTDRVGNIEELSGYLALWESMKAGVSRGLLAITVVEHDALTKDASIPYLAVGNDGRAVEGRSKE